MKIFIFIGILYFCPNVGIGQIKVESITVSFDDFWVETSTKIIDRRSGPRESSSKEFSDLTFKETYPGDQAILFSFDSTNNTITTLTFYVFTHTDNDNYHSEHFVLTNLHLSKTPTGYIATVSKDQIHLDAINYWKNDVFSDENLHSDTKVTLDTSATSKIIVAITGFLPLDVPKSVPKPLCSIFPNPTTNMIIIDNQESWSLLKIYSLNGYLIQEYPLSPGFNTIGLQLPVGAYYVQVGSSIQKILVQH